MKEQVKNMKIIMMYLNGCPYCNNAKRILEELNSNIEIEFIEENKHPEIADSLDYYYVPSFFKDGKKLYEASKSDTYDIMKNKIVEMLNKLEN